MRNKIRSFVTSVSGVALLALVVVAASEVWLTPQTWTEWG